MKRWAESAQVNKSEVFIITGGATKGGGEGRDASAEADADAVEKGGGCGRTFPSSDGREEPQNPLHQRLPFSPARGITTITTIAIATVTTSTATPVTPQPQQPAPSMFDQQTKKLKRLEFMLEQHSHCRSVSSLEIS